MTWLLRPGAIVDLVIQLFITTTTTTTTTKERSARGLVDEMHFFKK